MPRIAVAVSGGVDSLYALASLAEAGCDVFALHARFLPPELLPPAYEQNSARMRASCAKIGVALHIADCVAAFAEAVIDPFVDAYARGETPNPCAHCNARMKFGLLLDMATELGADLLATGHYVWLEQDSKGPALFSGADSAKDQSYFLSLVPAQRLARALFPLGALHKNEIRAWLAVRGLEAPAPAESQEICFVPQDAYRPFIMKRAAERGIALPGEGPMQMPDGQVLGRHRGLWQYTEGQRRGLGIAWAEPLYVLGKRIADNTLLVGEAHRFSAEGIITERMNFLVPFSEWPERLHIRGRYRQVPQPATVRKIAEGYFFHEKNPAGPYAQGQLLTVYAQEEPGNPDSRLRVLGGGIITGSCAHEE